MIGVIVIALVIIFIFSDSSRGSSSSHQYYRDSYKSSKERQEDALIMLRTAWKKKNKLASLVAFALFLHQKREEYRASTGGIAESAYWRQKSWEKKSPVYRDKQSPEEEDRRRREEDAKSEREFFAYSLEGYGFSVKEQNQARVVVEKNGIFFCIGAHFYGHSVLSWEMDFSDHKDEELRYKILNGDSFRDTHNLDKLFYQLLQNENVALNPAREEKMAAILECLRHGYFKGESSVYDIFEHLNIVTILLGEGDPFSYDLDTILRHVR